MEKILFIVPPNIKYEDFINPPSNVKVAQNKNGCKFGVVITDMPLGVLSLSAYVKNFSDARTKLVDFNIEFITKCCEFLEIGTKLVKSSDMNCEGTKGDLVLDICKNLGATEYLSGAAGANYLEDYRKKFDENNIRITYHDYLDPIYNQRGKQFIEKLSRL